MAEGFLRKMAGNEFDVFSAGTDPKDKVHPLAFRVMAEIGIDISEQSPKNLTQYLGFLPVHYLIIVCSDANETCPRIWPGVQNRMYWPFDDPASFQGSPEATLNEFRRVRDEIEQQIEGWLPSVVGRET
jgi:arsenate reductase